MIRLTLAKGFVKFSNREKKGKLITLKIGIMAFLTITTI